MVNLGILKNTFKCFLTYKAIQTRTPVLLVDSPYKSCIATHHEHVDVNVRDTSDTYPEIEGTFLINIHHI